MLATGLLLLALPQGPEVLLTEGLPMPGTPTQTVSSIGNTAVNSVGGWAVGTSVIDPAGTLSLIYGAPFGVTPSTLIIEGLYGTLQQTSYESFFGLDAAGVPVYSPSSTDTIGGTTGLDGCWAGTTVIANEDDPILSLPGKVFRFNSRPNVLATGEPVWIGGIDDISGTTEGNALFRGASQTVVLRENDVVPGMPFPLSPGGSIDFDFRFSPDGTQLITPVDLVAPSSTEDFYIYRNGAAHFIGGLIVGEDQPMPPALQIDPAEDWDNFDYMGATDSGSYMFTGDTNASDTARDEFILIDDAIVLREGDSVDGKVLSGSIEGAYLSNRGDWAAVWDVDDAVLGNVEALVFRGRLLLQEGDVISTDLTGDGLDEAGTLTNFTGLSGLTVGVDRACYITADLDYLGTSTSTDDVEVALRIPVQDLMADADTLSVAAGGTVNFSLFPPPEVDVDLYQLLGSTSGTAPGLLVDGLTLPLNVDSYTLYTLANPFTLPLSGGLGSLDANGTASATFTVPAAYDPVLVGLTVHHAYATFSFLSGTVTHTSNAVGITFTP